MSFDPTVARRQARGGGGVILTKALFTTVSEPTFITQQTRSEHTLSRVWLAVMFSFDVVVGLTGCAFKRSSWCGRVRTWLVGVYGLTGRTTLTRRTD